jgi:hypothetical protein
VQQQQQQREQQQWHAHLDGVFWRWYPLHYRLKRLLNAQAHLGTGPDDVGAVQANDFFNFTDHALWLSTYWNLKVVTIAISDRSVPE